MVISSSSVNERVHGVTRQQQILYLGAEGEVVDVRGGERALVLEHARHGRLVLERPRARAPVRSSSVTRNAPLALSATSTPQWALARHRVKSYAARSRSLLRPSMLRRNTTARSKHAGWAVANRSTAISCPVAARASAASQGLIPDQAAPRWNRAHVAGRARPHPFRSCHDANGASAASPCQRLR